MNKKNGKLVISVVVLSFVCLLCGCRVPSLEKPSKAQYWYRTSTDDHGVIMEVTLTSNDQIGDFFDRVLSDNQWGWWPSLVSYAPSIRLKSEDETYMLDVTSFGLLVLNYKGNPSDKRCIQIVKRVPNDVHDELQGLVERAMLNENNVKKLF